MSLDSLSKARWVPLPAAGERSIFSIDAGSSLSAFLLLRGSEILRFGKIPNSDLLAVISDEAARIDVVVTEFP